eukprot:194214_1
MANDIPEMMTHSDRVLSILGQNPGPFTLQGTNTYLVGSGSRRILIDTGEGKTAYLPVLLEAMRKNNVKSIQEVLLTHYHCDHVGGFKDLVGHFGSLKISKMVADISQKDERHHTVIQDLQANYNIQNINDGDIFRTEGATLRAVHTPGHTADHMVFQMECDDPSQSGAIFSGDCILGSGTTVFQDLYEYMKSLDRILSLKPIPRIYPGHGPVINDPVDRINQYISHRAMRDKQILEVLSQSDTPMSATEITKLVYTDTPENLMLAAENNLKLHLDKLNKEHKVSGSNSEGWRII